MKLKEITSQMVTFVKDDKTIEYKQIRLVFEDGTTIPIKAVYLADKKLLSVLVD